MNWKIMKFISIMFLLSLTWIYAEVKVVERQDKSLKISYKMDMQGSFYLSKKELLPSRIKNKKVIFTENIKLSKSTEWNNDAIPLTSHKLKGELFVENLLPNNQYYLYEVNSKSNYLALKFKTLQRAPIESPSSIVFNNKEAGFLNFKWKKGLGQGTIIIVSKDNPPELPKDGIVYKSGKYGERELNIGNNTYVVFSGKRIKRSSFKIEKLDYGEYFVAVLEYNGIGECRNYSEINLNGGLRNVWTLLPPPKNLKVTTVDVDVAYIVWEAVEYVERYEIEVSTDSEFKNLLEDYNKSDIGDLPEFAIVVDDTQLEYYWRIRCVGKGGPSEWSGTQILNYGKK
jgi:hypothetical protein